MGSYLKAGKLAQTRAAYFKPEGASWTIYPARVNANFADLSDGPLKDNKSISIGDRDAEDTESLSRESTALHSHLLWLSDLLMVLTHRLEDPSAVTVIQPILVKVLEHQKWVQALLTDNQLYPCEERPGHKFHLWPGSK